MDIFIPLGSKIFYKDGINTFDKIQGYYDYYFALGQNRLNIVYRSSEFYMTGLMIETMDSLVLAHV